MAETTYCVKKTDRRTIAICILPDGRVEVRCPRRTPSWQVESFVRSKSAWIAKQLSKPREAVQKLTTQELKELTAYAARQIPLRAAHFASMIGVTYGSITIRHQKTRWGSCSAKGNLNFNCLLMLAPPEVLDYVVVHELCHRKEMNHSADFWAEVAGAMPGYDTCRKWLKNNGAGLIARLP